MRNAKSPNQLSGILWGITALLLVALLFARAVYPEYLWLTVGVCVPLVATLGSLIHFNRRALKSRTTAYGVNSMITILLVVAIVGVIDFLSSRYPHKLDLTKNKLHTLSDETTKTVKGLTKPVKATFFAKIAQREQFRPLLENYKGLSPKFELEYVDPDREPTRTRQAGVTANGTLYLQVGARDSKVTDPTEEKITNALIKLYRDKIPVFCAIEGHGEHSLDSNEADGYSSMKKALLEQSYDTKAINLLQEAKIPESCDAIAILGPSKAFFPQETKLIGDYLSNGGRAVIGVDLNVKGAEFSPELVTLLKDWHIQTDLAMIIDPGSRQLGVDAAVPIVGTFSRESAITRDLRDKCVFPFLRPLDIVPGAPAGLNVQWLAKTTSTAIRISDLKQIAAGQVAIDPSKATTGPFTSAIAIDGKAQDSKAARNTRMVVFGTSNFANNNYSRYGGNSDLFLNSVAWILEDNNMISIRTKEEAPSAIEMSQKQGAVIGLITIVILPLMTWIAGFVVWFRRRTL